MTATAAQLSFEDLPSAEPGRPLHGMQRLGETFEFGAMLMQLLGLAGWTVVITKPFAGIHELEQEHADGVLVIAERDGLEVRRTGASLADVASEIFSEAMALLPPRAQRKVMRGYDPATAPIPY